MLEWDARSYDALPLPHEHWDATAIAQLRLNGDETVLDLGCGTGRDAEHLLTLLPHGHVVAVDGSRRSELRGRLADNLTVLHADLRQPLHLPQSVDAAVSVATLHWLPDHAAVFRTVAAALCPGRATSRPGSGRSLRSRPRRAFGRRHQGRGSIGRRRVLQRAVRSAIMCG